MSKPKGPPWTCCVCGRNRVAMGCKCPWNLPFADWPEVLLKTVEAMVAGGPRER